MYTGLLIWQHDDPNEGRCNVDSIIEFIRMKNSEKDKIDYFKRELVNLGNSYNCEGTIITGLKRSFKEGKKYKNKQWVFDIWAGAMEKGKEFMIKAPGRSFSMHNSGKINGISILVEYVKKSNDNSINLISQEKNIIKFIYPTNEKI